MKTQIQKNIERTKQLLAELDVATIENASNLSISQKDIFWQCDHIFRAIVAIINGLHAPKDKPYTGKMALSGKILINLEYFPRGKGKAPKVTMTDESITRATLTEIKEKAMQQLDSLSNTDSSAYFKHPLFGQMNLKWASKLLYVHTKHHLKIVKEIGKN